MRGSERRRLAVAVTAAAALGVVAVLAVLLAMRGGGSQPGNQPDSGADALVGARASTDPPDARAAALAERAVAADVPPSLGRSGIVVHGTVRDREGRVIEGVAVSFDGPGSADREVRSGPGGMFVVDGLDPATYQVIARSPQALTHSEFLALDGSAGQVALVLEVDSGWPVAGQVIDDQGRPVAGARVTPWRRGASGDELDPRASVTTDGAGMFELRGPTTGMTFALVEQDGFAPAKARLGPRRAVVVRLQPAK